jgi:hypothetical protein
MKFNKTLIALAIGLTIFLDKHLLLNVEAGIYPYAGERVMYLISPLGRAEYADLGLVDLNGIKVNLLMFRTKVLFVEDIQKIYSDPESLLPYKIDRTISKFWGKEHTIEEYDQKNFTVVIREVKGVKSVNERTIKANGPIQCPVLFSLYLSRYPGLQIGRDFTARIPDEVKFRLLSIDKIIVPAGRFQAYHFKSIPDKFEIWINKDVPRVPLKIKGKGGLDFALVMNKYNMNGSDYLNESISNKH